MSASRAAALCTALLVALYLVISLHRLDTVPPVHEDEPWQASTGFKLATEGVFGSDLMTGFFGMEQRYYAFMPVHPLLLAAAFRIWGVGLFQARLETVLLGLAVLILTGLVAVRLFDDQVAVVAMAVLVAVPWLPVPPFRLTGIPLLDQARIARYDLGVAAFALSALLLFLSASERRSPWRFAAAGAMVGVAGLCHVYGFFWLPVLLILGVWNKERPHHLAALIVGLVVTVLPYASYVLSDLETWAAQTYQYAPRFDLFNPGWYLENLRAEPHRYGITTMGRLLRPGPLLLLIAVPSSIIVLLRRSWSDHDRAARAVAVPAVTMPLMLALLITIKQPGYLLTVIPLGAAAMAWVAVSLWRRAHRLWRPILAAVAIAVAAHGAAAIAALEHQARVTTPYPELVHRLRADIPAGSRVLALHRFWFGLEEFEVRSWWVPIALADPRTSPSVIDFGRSLDAFDPDIFLVDDEVRATFTGRPQLGHAFRAHLEDGGFVQLARVIDPTYGRIDVYGRSSGRSFGSLGGEDPRSR